MTRLQMLLGVLGAVLLLTAWTPLTLRPDSPELAASVSSAAAVSSPLRAAPAQTPAPAPAPATQAPAISPVATDCTARNVTCVTADQKTQLTVATPGKIIDGRGHRVPNIKILADHVTVRNFYVTGGTQAGIWSQGVGNVISDNDISQIAYGHDDIDAIRFFGSGTKVLRNKVHNLVRGSPGDAHVDCMQTYANALPGSSDIEIAGNDCRGTDLHQCVMAEGPGSTDGGGGGGGRSRNWWVHDNYFACHANQNVSFRNVTNSVIERNTFAGSGAKAVQLTDGSTNVTVRGNNLGSGYGTVAGD